MNQPPFMMFPNPFGWNQQQHRQDDRVPRRVAVACEVLTDLTMKQMTRCHANDVGFNEVEGMRLQPEEMQVFRSACNLLVAYFDGTLKPTPSEKAEVKQEGLRSLLRCPQCGGSGRGVGEPCVVCKGSGALSVVPANPQGE